MGDVDSRLTGAAVGRGGREDLSCGWGREGCVLKAGSGGVGASGKGGAADEQRTAAAVGQEDLQGCETVRSVPGDVPVELPAGHSVAAAVDRPE